MCSFRSSELFKIELRYNYYTESEPVRQHFSPQPPIRKQEVKNAPGLQHQIARRTPFKPKDSKFRLYTNK